MGRQHGAQLGINIAALDMALALTRSQAISKVLTALGTFAVRHHPKTVRIALATQSVMRRGRHPAGGAEMVGALGLCETLKFGSRISAISHVSKLSRSVTR
jgi:hypothetical protein